MQNKANLSVCQRFQTYPFTFHILRKDKIPVFLPFQLESFIVCPFIIPFLVYLNNKRQRRFGMINNMCHTSVESGKQIRFAYFRRKDNVLQPNSSISGSRSPVQEIFFLSEPQIGLWLTGENISLNTRLIGCQYNLPVP